MRKLASFVCLVMLVTACANGTTPSGTDVIKGNFTKSGFVALGDSAFSQGGVISTSVSGFGSFATLPKAVTEIPKNPFAAVTDTCFVTSDNITNPPFPVDDPTDNLTSLDAGNALSIKNGTETLLVLEKDTVAGTVISYLGRKEDQTLPSQGITLSIPGADFPAFNDLAFGDVAPLTVSSPNDVDNVTLDTTFTWNAGKAGDLFIFFVTQESPSALAACYAKDDGTFTFPDKAKTELSATGFVKGSFFQPQRWSIRVETKEDAYLFLLTSTVVPIPVPPPPTLR